MGISDEVRLLEKKWRSGTGWPKRLESLQITGIRGWKGERIQFDFPIVAVIGANGSGKSTVLQAAASVYAGPQDAKTWFPTDFFPETAWDKIAEARIDYSIREGNTSSIGSLRKFESKWRGYKERKERHVEYVDLRRIQPLSARVGYARIAKSAAKEVSSTSFDEETVNRLSFLMQRSYEIVRFATSDIDETRSVPVARHLGAQSSGFHHGAGEIVSAEFLKTPLKKYSLVLIDEIETSLHPTVQRRWIRDLANICRQREIQIILSTHSPFIIEELPDYARSCIVVTNQGRTIVNGVSPQFALTIMDDRIHPSCEVWVEDVTAQALVREAISFKDPDLVLKVQVMAYGAASVGTSLGIMVNQGRLPRPTCVFLDGDQGDACGCHCLPGNDAPERVVFSGLKRVDWGDVHIRVNRDQSRLIDACEKAMTLGDHHEWIRSAANNLGLGGQTLWPAMCASWSKLCASNTDLEKIVTPIYARLS